MFIVPGGMFHQVDNLSDQPSKILTMYLPTHYPKGFKQVNQ